MYSIVEMGAKKHGLHMDIIHQVGIPPPSASCNPVRPPGSSQLAKVCQSQLLFRNQQTGRRIHVAPNHGHFHVLSPGKWITSSAEGPYHVSLAYIVLTNIYAANQSL
jgi:hypothetical protein